MINITFINIIVYKYLIAVNVVMEWNNMHALPNTTYFKGKLVCPLCFPGEFNFNDFRGEFGLECGGDLSMIKY